MDKISIIVLIVSFFVIFVTIYDDFITTGQTGILKTEMHARTQKPKIIMHIIPLNSPSHSVYNADNATTVNYLPKIFVSIEIYGSGYLQFDRRVNNGSFYIIIMKNSANVPPTICRYHENSNDVNTIFIGKNNQMKLNTYSGKMECKKLNQ